MSKNNAILTEKHNAPEDHHRIKSEIHRALQAQPGHCYCTKCGAIGFQKHWYMDAEQEYFLRQDKNAHAVLCPGCTRVEQEQFEGEVIITNSRFATLMGEVIAMIKHTEGRCWHHNPTARIADVTEEKEILHIRTTTMLLAERIGKELKRAFKGNLEIKRSPGELYVRVYWTD